MEILRSTEQILNDFNIPYEKKIISAHRTPEGLYDFAKINMNKEIEVVIAGAGGAAHLPGMIAALTTTGIRCSN